MTKRLIEGWAHVCLSYRRTILLGLAAITLLAATGLPHTRFDNALEIWFLDDDPALLAHRRLLDRFGSDEMILIGLEAPDVFAPPVLERIDRLTREIEKAPHVEKVFSLTNIEAVSGSDDAIDVHNLIEFPLDLEALPAIRKRALTNELYVGNIVSATGEFSCIVVRLPHYTNNFDYKVEAVGAIREILAREHGSKLYLAGGPVIDEQFFALSEQDSRLTITLMIVLLAASLWFLLRSAAGVLLPLATVTVATVWAMGWIVLYGARVNIITTMLPPLLLAVGVADSMHILVDYQSRCRRGQDKIDALYTVYRELMPALFLTSLTTAIGMLSLMVSRVRGIREFGAFAALGVAGAFLLSVTFVPIVLSYLPAPRMRAARISAHGLSADALNRLHRYTMEHAGRIVLISTILLLVGIAGAMRVRAESVFLEYFKKGQAVRVDTERIEQALAGTFTIEVMVDTDREDGIKDPAVLQQIADLQTFLEADPDVSSSQSITDYFKDLRRAFFGNEQHEYRLPETREEAAQYLLLYEMSAPDGDIKEYVTYDYSQARVSARVAMHSSSAAEALVKRVQLYLDTHFSPDLHGTVSGVALLYANMEEYIRRSLIRGFSIAIIAIFIVFCLQMRSVGVGAIAMIPNILPIVLCLGVMGFSGILLDTMTAMVASIAIGLAVDDSIHFVSRVRLHLEAGDDIDIALHDTTVEIGRAIVYTSLALCAGFGVMLVASFVGEIHFGLLSVLTILFALAGDLFLLPVVLRWYDKQVHGAALLRPSINRPTDVG